MQRERLVSFKRGFLPLQDESCIAAHLGERAPKGAEDESATQEQQEETEQGGDHDESMDGTGDILPFCSKFCIVQSVHSIPGKQRGCVFSAVYRKVSMVQYVHELRGAFPAQTGMRLGLILTCRACQPLMSHILDF